MASKKVDDESEETIPKTAYPTKSTNSGKKLTRVGYEYELAEPHNLKDVTCSVCQWIIRDAKQISVCGHSFCSTCWDDTVAASGEEVRCPLDQQVVDLSKVFDDTKHTRYILGLRVNCVNKDSGCNVTPEIRYIQIHLETCVRQTVSCDLLCGEKMLLHELDHHMKQLCLMRMLACQLCGVEFMASVLESHDETCCMKLLNCGFCGAPDILRKEILEHHREECQKIPTFCSFALIGCTEKIIRESLTEHHETHTQHHLQLLNISLCNNIMSGQTQSEGMELELPSNLWPNVSMDESDASIDWMELPGCVYDINSCSLKSLIDRVVKLEKSKQSHIDEVTGLKKRNRELENNMIGELTELKKSYIDELTKLKKSHTDDITELKRSYINELTEVKKHNSKEESKVKNSQQKYERIEASMAYIPKQLVPGEDNMCPCQWQVEVEKGMERIESPPFHTKTGYSMDFCAWFKEGHVIAGVLLLKGDHDDELTWPWDGKERLTITDARSDVVHNIVHSQSTGKLRVPKDKERNVKYLCYTEFPLNEGKTVLTFTMSDFINDA